MIPKIVFRYSSVHDGFWKNYLELYYNVHKMERTKKILDEYPNREQILEYIEIVKPKWKQEETKILNKISELMQLQWKDEVIKVYVVGAGIPYSDPLTIVHYKEDYVAFIDVLTHELIHQLQSQNSTIYSKWITHLGKTYPEEKRKTKSHILLHAVHKLLYLELFTQERLEKNIQKSAKKPAYKRAWDIVEEEGAENILKKFHEVIGA